MGVHGLWRLIEPSGKPVPVETLENKVLAVDVSIWLHQAVKGFQDAKGATLQNAHLLGIYHRVCKLLYFKIKPIFVFDGGVPALKKQTIAKRNQLKQKNITSADSIQRQLLTSLIKHSAVNKVITEKAKSVLTSPPKQRSSKTDDLFKLPEIEHESSFSASSEEEESTDSSPTKHWDMHTIDTKSAEFKSLPADVRHEILTDLKETRKQSSWGRLHELPTQSNDFSSFQMRRLLKRQAVQSALEEAEKEMGGHSLSLGELENILKDQGVISNAALGQRIAADENTRYLFIKNVKVAIEEARKKKEQEEKLSRELDEAKSSLPEKDMETNIEKSGAELEYEEDLQAAIALSLECEPSTSSQAVQATPNKLSFSFLKDITIDSESEDEGDKERSLVETNLDSARSYMKEYSGLSAHAISKIINSESTNQNIIKNKNKLVKKSSSNKFSTETITSTDTDSGLVLQDSISDMSQETNPSLEIEQIVDSSSADEDFVDVDTPKKEKVTTSTCMEIVIDRDTDALEDDLFADIFSENDKLEKTIQDTKEVLKELEKSEDIIKETFSIPQDLKNVEIKESGDVLQKNLEESEKTKVILSEEKQNLMKSDIVQETSEMKIPKEVDLVEKIIENTEKSEINEKKNNKTLTTDELLDMRDSLATEQDELMEQRNTKERMGSNISDQMYQEAQELLELFGVPYIIAPMEAEAQCAFLDSISFTDGTITDDSDIWLFGGRTVYKNFFNQAKHVLEFKAENIQHHFRLSREQMILLALLVGSDYTSGLQGVGPVTALEILAAFPYGNVSNLTLSHTQLLNGLKEFRTWITDSHATSKRNNSLRSKLKNIVLTESFPSLQVVQAYLDPQVDKNEEKCTWSKPDIIGLTHFAKMKFGWSQLKSEEILKPVIKKIKESAHQANIKNYFKSTFQVKSGLNEAQMSKRVQKAIKKMGEEPDEEKEKPKVQRKRAKKKMPTLFEDDLELEAITDELFEQLENESKNTELESDIQQLEKKNSVESEPVPSKKAIKKSKTSIDNCDMATVAPSTSTKISSTGKTVENTTRKRKNAVPDENIKSKKLNVETNIAQDEDLQVLKQVAETSKTMQKNIKSEIAQQLQKQISREKHIIRKVHRKEIVPQKQMEKNEILQTKLRAIEVFRKSKKGPGFLKKGRGVTRKIKNDADLSESSDSN